MIETVLGGFLENAMIRKIDAEVNPDRNHTGHPYYISLNRDVDQSIKRRCDAFLSISQSISLPMVDWGVPDEQFFSFINFNEELIPSDPRTLAEFLINSNIFSTEVYEKISSVDTSSVMTKQKGNAADLEKRAAIMYVERLLQQIRVSGQANKILVISENEIDIIKDISDFLATNKIPTPFDFPDLSTTGTIPADPIGCLIDFEAKDIENLNAIRKDGLVREYSNEVLKVLSSTTFENSEVELVRAMRSAQKHAQTFATRMEAFEVFHLGLKPFNYIPGVSFFSTMAGDIVEGFERWRFRKREPLSWHLIGARLQTVSVEEYLSRKDNVG